MKLYSIIAAGVALIAAAASCCQQAEQTTGENQVIENIMSRRSIRKYKPVAVSRDTLQTILECGINAPNGMNKQSWEVRIADNPAVMEEIQAMMTASNPEAKPEMVKGCFRDAPVMIFIANDPSYDCSPIDCGLLSENIISAQMSTLSATRSSTMLLPKLALRW